MKIFVGIDIAKLNHFAAAISSAEHLGTSPQALANKFSRETLSANELIAILDVSLSLPNISLKISCPPYSKAALL